MPSALLCATFAGYVAGLLFYFLHFECSREVYLRWARRLVGASLLLHLFGVAWPALRQENADALAALSRQATPFLIIAAAVILEWKLRARNLVLFSLPAGLLFYLLAVVPGRGERIAATEPSPWLWMHVGLMLIGVAGLILSACAAALYAWQSHQLKQKKPGLAFVRLLSLESLDRLHFRAFSVGAVFFSLGILSGLFWATDTDRLQPLFSDRKVLLSFATIFMYAAVFAFRMKTMNRGWKIAAGTMTAFILLLATFFSTHDVASTMMRVF